MSVFRQEVSGIGDPPCRRRCDAERCQPRGGGQPAISPWALLPHRLIQPFVPQVRLVSTNLFGNACPAVRARRERHGAGNDFTRTG